MKNLAIFFPFEEKHGNTVLFQSLRELCALTGLKVCFYDLTFFSKEISKFDVPEKFRIHCSPFCSYIKISPSAHERCRKVEYEILKKCFVQRKPFLVYRCFAGLTQIVIPFVVGGKLVGGLAVGQVFSDHKYPAVMTNLARKYKYNYETLMALAKPIPVASKSLLTKNVAVWKLIGAYMTEVLDKRHLLQRLEKHEEPFVGNNIPCEIPMLFPDSLETASPAIRKTFVIIKAKYRENPKRCSVATDVGMGESTFARLLKKETGLSFSDILLKTKLSAAVYLLRRSSLNVAEISAYLGYEDVASFSKIFKSAFGCSPLRYIRRPI